MSGVIVKACTCEHEYQDSKYGIHQRVHNLGKKGEERCTVCCPSRRSNVITAYAKNHETGRDGGQPGSRSSPLTFLEIIERVPLTTGIKGFGAAPPARK